MEDILRLLIFLLLILKQFEKVISKQHDVTTPLYGVIGKSREITELRFSDGDDCDVTNKWKMKSWMIEGEKAIYVWMLNSSNFTCDQAHLVMSSSDERICDQNNLLIGNPPLKISFYYTFCSITFDVISFPIDLRVMTSQRPNHQIDFEFFIFPMIREHRDVTSSVTCFIAFGDATFAIFDAMNVTHQYPSAGKFFFDARCSTRDDVTLRYHGAVSVDEQLTSLQLRVHHDDVIKIGDRTSIVVTNQRVKQSLHYQLHFVELSRDYIVMATSSGTRDKLQVTWFELSSAIQWRLGAGSHDYFVTVANERSCMISSRQRLLLHSKILGLTVQVPRVIGQQPFEVIIATDRGAPINFELCIDDIITNRTVSTFKARCDTEASCHLMRMTSRVHRLHRFYQIRVLAFNQITAPINDVTLVHALPRVYDVYTVTESRNPMTSLVSVDFYVRADPGFYDVTISYARRSSTNRLELGSGGHHHKPLPFASHDYDVIHQKVVLDDVTEVEVEVRGNGHSEDFHFHRYIYPPAASQRHDVIIRDSSLFPITRPAQLYTDDDVILAANVYANDLLIWKIYKVDTASVNPPQERDRRDPDDFTSSTTNHSEIRIPTSSLHPGTYLIWLSSRDNDVISSSMQRSTSDFCYVTIKTRSVAISIDGGDRREISSAESNSIDFEVIPRLKPSRFCFNWFWARNQADLPSTSTRGIARFTKFTSSFDDVTGAGWLSNQSAFSINSVHFPPGNGIHVRVFVRRNKDGCYGDEHYDDQLIIASRFLAPHMQIKCRTNCGVKLKTHLRHVIELLCATCVTLQWHLDGHVVAHCRNLHICRLDNHQARPRRLLVTGSNRWQVTSSILKNLTYIEPPEASCSVTPRDGIAYVTNFTIRCHLTSKAVDSLIKFKLYARNKDRSLTFLHHDFNKHFEVTSSATSLFLLRICQGSCLSISLQVDIQPATSRAMMTSFPVLGLTKVDDVIDVLAARPLISAESAQRAAEFLKSVIARKGVTKQRQILRTVDHIYSFIQSRQNFIDDDDVNDVVTSSLQAVVQLMSMQTKNVSMNDFKRLNVIGRFMLGTVTPVDKPIRFEYSGIKCNLARKYFEAKNDSQFDPPLHLDFTNFTRMYPVTSQDFYNIKMYNFDGDVFNFNTSKYGVSDVTAVSLSRGWDDLPFRGHAGNLIRPFFGSRDRKRNWIILPLKASSVCDVTGCNAHIAATRDFTRPLGGGAIQIQFDNRKGYVISLQMKVTSSDYMTTKNFTTSETFYRWQLELPSNMTSLRLKLVGKLGEVQTVPLVAKVSLLQLDCLNWNARNRDWSRDLCAIEYLHQLGTIGCRCTRLYDTSLALFASRVLPLNGRQEEASSLMTSLENSAFVSVVMVIMFLILVIGIYITEKLNKKDAKKIPFIQPQDSFPDHQYRYYVTIYTGSRYESGSTATVAINLIGSNSISDAHLIQTAYNPVLTRGSVTSYLITTRDRLGDICGLRLWRGSEGINPKWFLSRVTVRDLETNEVWFFSCNLWFENVVDAAVPATELTLLNRWINLFKSQFDLVLKQRYHWRSFFLSNWNYGVLMSRYQQLACCMLTLHIISLTSFIFYLREATRKGVHSTLKPFYFNSSQFLIGFISSLISLPLMIIISLIFEKTERQKTVCKTKGSMICHYQSFPDDEVGDNLISSEITQPHPVSSLSQDTDHGISFHTSDMSFKSEISQQPQNQSEQSEKQLETSTSYLQPSKRNLQPSKRKLQPSKNHLRLSTNHLRPSTNHLRLSTSHLRQSTNHLRPSRNHLRLSTNHLRLSTSHLRLSKNHRRPSINHLRLSTNHLKPSTNHLRLSTNHIKPSTNHLRPPINHLRPSINHLRAFKNHLRPSTNHLRLSTNHLRPSTNHLRLSTNHLRPSTHHLKLPTSFFNLPQVSNFALSAKQSTKKMSADHRGRRKHEMKIPICSQSPMYSHPLKLNQSDENLASLKHDHDVTRLFETQSDPGSRLVITRRLHYVARTKVEMTSQVVKMTSSLTTGGEEPEEDVRSEKLSNFYEESPFCSSGYYANDTWTVDSSIEPSNVAQSISYHETETKEAEKSDEKRAPSATDPQTTPPSLPIYFSFISWLITIATVTLSFVVIFSSASLLGLGASIEWFVAMTVGILLDVLFFEPLVIVMVALVRVYVTPIHDVRCWLTRLPEEVKPRRHHNAIQRSSQIAKNRLIDARYRPPTSWAYVSRSLRHNVANTNGAK